MNRVYLAMVPAQRLALIKDDMDVLIAQIIIKDINTVPSYAGGYSSCWHFLGGEVGGEPTARQLRGSSMQTTELSPPLQTLQLIHPSNEGRRETNDSTLLGMKSVSYPDCLSVAHAWRKMDV